MLPAGAAGDRLIQAAERDVDRLLGAAYERNPTTGRKLDPAALTTAQIAALERATAAAVEYRLSVDSETLTGATDFAPAQLAV